MSADDARTVDDAADACDGSFGIPVPQVEHILGVGVVEPTSGGPPRCMTGVAVERDGDEHTLVLIRKRSQLTFDDQRREAEGERLPLSAPVVPSRRGTGVTARWTRSDGTHEELLIRRVVPSDASWLSVHGFDALLDVRMLEELVERRATWRPIEESMLLLALPRTAPHALTYRIGSTDDQRTWFRIGGRWLEHAEALRIGVPARVTSVFDAIQPRPWATALSPDISHLLAETCPRQRVQPWALAAAMALVDREVRDHDELLGLLLGSPADAVVDAATLGPDLARVVTGIGAYAEDYLEYLREAHEEWLSEGGLDDPDPEDTDSDEEIVELAGLADPTFSLTTRALVSMLDDFERHLGDPEPAQWGR